MYVYIHTLIYKHIYIYIVVKTEEEDDAYDFSTDYV